MDMGKAEALQNILPRFQPETVLPMSPESLDLIDMSTYDENHYIKSIP